MFISPSHAIVGFDPSLPGRIMLSIGWWFAGMIGVWFCWICTMQFSEQHNLNRQQLYICFCFLHLASYFWGRIGSSKWINFTTVAGDAYPNSWDLMGGPRCSQSKHASAQLIFCLLGQMNHLCWSGFGRKREGHWILHEFCKAECNFVTSRPRPTLWKAWAHFLLAKNSRGAWPSCHRNSALHRLGRCAAAAGFFFWSNAWMHWKHWCLAAVAGQCWKMLEAGV